MQLKHINVHTNTAAKDICLQQLCVVFVLILCTCILAYVLWPEETKTMQKGCHPGYN